MAGINFGAVKIHFFHMSEIERNILFEVRIPRVLLAGEVGACLVLAGILFQYVLQNPLADSFTTGASASSALGAVVAIAMGFTRVILLFSLGFCLAGLLLVYKTASIRGKILPITVLLAGIVISTFASSAISFIKFLSQESVSSIVFWLMGGFQNADYLKVLLLFVVLIFVFFRLKRLSLAIDLLAFDENTAVSTGVNVYSLRKELMFHGALLTAFCVSFSGIIGFVGLIVPHILRLLKFRRADELFFSGMLCGAGFMLSADTVSRLLLKGGEELPVGILTSTLGGAFFLYLLLIRKKRFQLWET